MPQITQLADVFASQLFWLAVVFGLIFFGIGRGMLPKVRSTIDERDKKVAEDLEIARSARTLAEETEAEWRVRRDEARIEAARIGQQAKQESARQTEARVRKAFDEIDAKVELARLRIRSAVEGARIDMEAVAAEAAEQMVEQLTGLKIERKDATQAVAAELALMSGTVQSDNVARTKMKPRRVSSRAR
jgi:F-type H+-transporting ATPase subunit b